MVKKLLQLLGFPTTKHANPIEESLKKLDDAERRVSVIEEVTLTWEVNNLTDEQKREIGFDPR